MAATTLLPDLITQIAIPVCAVVGIVFALVQWVLVSKVKLTTEKSHSGDAKNGFTEALIEEEDGVSDHSVVQKCAEIQAAISEGEFRSIFMNLFMRL